MKFVATLLLACVVLLNLFEFSAAQDLYGGYGGQTGGYGGYGGQTGGYGGQTKGEKPGIITRIENKIVNNKPVRRINFFIIHPNEATKHAYDKIKRKLFGKGTPGMQSSSMNTGSGYSTGSAAGYGGTGFS